MFAGAGGYKREREGGRRGSEGRRRRNRTNASSHPPFLFHQPASGNGLSLTGRKKLPNNSNPFLQIIEAEPLLLEERVSCKSRGPSGSRKNV